MKSTPQNWISPGHPQLSGVWDHGHDGGTVRPRHIEVTHMAISMGEIMEFVDGIDMDMYVYIYHIYIRRPPA